MNHPLIGLLPIPAMKLSAARRHLPAIAISSLAGLVSIQAIEVPKKAPLARYSPLWNDSCFTSKPLISFVPVPAPVAPPSATAGPFTYTTANGAVTILKYTGQGKDLVIPDKINGVTVTSIGEKAFMGCASLLDVTIPATVTRVGGAAFGNCPKLTGVHFKGDAPSLGKEVFQESPKATIYYIPSSTGWGKEFGGRPTKVWEVKVKAEN